MFFHRLAVALLLMFQATALAHEPLLDLPLDGNLGPATMHGGDGQAFEQVPFLDGQGAGVQLPARATLTARVHGINPDKGTISFWFRPEWSPADYAWHPIVELSTQAGFRIDLREGYSHVIAPDMTYVNLVDTTASSGMTVCGSDTLFTAGQWRFYTIRWSRSQERLELLVDGNIARRARLKPRQAASPQATTSSQETTATLKLFSGEMAYHGVKVFDHALPDAAIEQIAGRPLPGAYLTVQTPPVHIGRTGDDSASSYIDPATGERISSDGVSHGFIYNPARMPKLPVTPHTRWARPLPGERLRVLMVMPNEFHSPGSMLREGVELWQRLDMDCDIATRATDELLGKTYDVIIVSHQGYQGSMLQGWQDLDARLRDWIIHRVASGASGLVLAYPTRLDAAIESLMPASARIDSAAVVRGFPAAAVNAMNLVGAKGYEPLFTRKDDFFQDPTTLARQVVEVYHHGKVRAVKLNYLPNGNSPNMGLTPDTARNQAATDVDYDHWQALTARAVLFAAGREPATRIESIDIQDNAWRVRISHLNESATLAVRARDAWGNSLFATQQQVGQSGEVAIHATQIPGHVSVDAILRNAAGQVLDWHAVASPVSTQARITDITLDKEQYARGDMLQGQAKLTGILPGQYELVAYLTDHLGRRLTRTRSPIELAAGQQVQVPFAMTIPPSATSLVMRVEVELHGQAGVLDTLSTSAAVPVESFDDYYAGMSATPLNRLTDRLARHLLRDEYGMNLTLRSGPYNYGAMARDNLVQVEYSTHLGYPSNEANFAPWIEQWDDFLPAHLRGDLKKVRPYKPLFYSLGEEHFMLMGASHHPLATKRFIAYLQRQYASLEALNASWETSYESWDQVRMLSPHIVDVQAPKSGRALVDNRRFMETLFADKHAVTADYIRKQVPEGDVGIHVGWDLWMGRGYDYWKLSRALDAMIGYEGPQNQYIRSFMKRYYGHWYHYELGNVDNARWNMWQPLLSGGRGSMWYTLNSQRWGAVTADMQLGSDFASAADDFKAAAEAGQLLVRAEYQQNQVAIHYSQSSYHSGVPDLSWVHMHFINLFFDSAIPFKFISYDQLADGLAVKEKYPLLVLPHSVSLSPQEVAAIREYVAEGGVLWADVMPGGKNQHGMTLPANPLADLFDAMETRTLAGEVQVKAKPWGRGAVILADIGQYGQARNRGRAQEALAMLQFVQQAASLKPVVKLTDAQTGQAASGIWTAGYRQGSHQYIVVNKDYRLVDKQASNIQLSLDTAGYWYQTTGGKFLDHGQHITAPLNPTHGQVFAILPYKVTSIQASLKQPAKRGQDAVIHVQLATEGDATPNEHDLHLIHVTVADPSGEEVLSLRRHIPLMAGQGDIHLPVAWNDPPGRWRVTLRDAATGVTQQATYDLPAPQP